MLTNNQQIDVDTIDSKIDDMIFERISTDAQRLKDVIDSWVGGRRTLKEAHKSELEDYDQRMLTFLWRCRPLLSTVVIARMVGLSRQRLYEKWAKFGFDTNEEAQ